MRTRRVFAGCGLIALIPMWACNAQEAQQPTFRDVSPSVLADHLATVVADPAAACPAYWHEKPALLATLAYPLVPHLSEQDMERVKEMKEGLFQPTPYFKSVSLGVPPPWDENPFNNRTWDFHRHTLRWLIPLLASWKTTGDTASLALATETIQDWIRANSAGPGASTMAWNDHAAAQRARVLCWFWELWRKGDAYEPELAKLLLASLYQHGLFLCDARNFDARSNHSMQVHMSLLAIAVGFPEFRDSPRWNVLATQRLEAYVTDNMSPQGFHLEHSPSYHFYIIGNIGRTIRFLEDNHLDTPAVLRQRMNRALSLCAYLIRPDGRAPNVGDSDDIDAKASLKSFLALYRREQLPVAPSTLRNPRPDPASFMLDPLAGYAIFTSYRVQANVPVGGTYAMLRCNWRPVSHCHHDALSFVLYGLGRDWLVDSGQLNYEERTPARQYMLSARAHNVLLVDGEDFGYRPLRVVGRGRDERGDFVSVRHELKQAAHTRTFWFVPPHTIEITDEVESTDDQPHEYTQLLHLAPDLSVSIESSTRATLRAHDGSRCVIEQLGGGGGWSVIQGQREPLMQGWYSRKYNKMESNPVLCYTTPERKKSQRFVTRIELRPADAR